MTNGGTTMQEPIKTKDVAMKLMVRLIVSLLILTGCTVPSLSTLGKGSQDATVMDASPLTGTQSTSGQTVNGTISGVVLGLDGRPAANVQVHGYVVDASLVANHTASYRVLADNLDTQTDSNGRFNLANSSGQPLNVEAVLSDSVKAIQFNVTSSAQLQLAYTGAISGKVTAPQAPGIQDFTGVDVFIPGTSYLAKTDQSGNYTLSNVPPGTFNLVASKMGLGTASITGVTVESRNTATAPDLALSNNTPVISSVSPANAGPGAEVTLSGDNFGASSGAPLQVFFSGAIASTFNRIDDHTLKAIVPPGARSGNIAITVGGLTSNAPAFQVIRSLSLTASTWDIYLRTGDQRQFTVTALDTEGQAVPTPAVQWSVNDGVLSIDQNGDVRALTVGSALLSATSGTVSASLQVTVNTMYAPISASSSVLTLAGTRSVGFKDGPGNQALFSYPLELAIDQGDNVYVPDYGNNKIREVAPDGTTTTLAGVGVPGFQDGDGINAEFNEPDGIAMDSQGVLYIADYGNHRIRRLLPDGTVNTFVGAAGYGHQDGSAAQCMFYHPGYMTFDGSGNLLVADNLVTNTASGSVYTGYIRKIAPDGTTTTLVGGDPSQLGKIAAIAVDSHGQLYAVDYPGLNGWGTGRLLQIGSDGTITPLFSNLNFTAVAADSMGNVYAAASQYNICSQILEFQSAATYSLLVNANWRWGLQDGPLSTARFTTCAALAAGPRGGLYTIEYGAIRFIR